LLELDVVKLEQEYLSCLGPIEKERQDEKSLINEN
jgi:hypothetical protein